jgi:hypothetical protein
MVKQAVKTSENINSPQVRLEIFKFSNQITKKLAHPDYPAVINRVLLDFF